MGIEAPEMSLPGAEATDTESVTSLIGQSNLSFVASELMEGSQSSVAVPVRLVRIPAPDAQVMSLQVLADAGDLTPILRRGQSFWRGFLAKGIQRNGEMPLPIDAKNRFSRQDDHAVVLAEWDAVKSLKFQASMGIYDLDNHRVVTSKIIKVSASPHRKGVAAWNIPFAGLAAGVYRVDVLADDDVVWRTFFRLED